MDPYEREQIDGWVADFVEGEAGGGAATGEHAAPVLATLLASACDASGHGPDELEAADLRDAFLGPVARLDLPDAERRGVPDLCRDFLAALEEQGRLADGRDLGLQLAARREAFEAASGGRVEPIRRPGSKLGRNDPCPCGSGKKFKRCCMTS